MRVLEVARLCQNTLRQEKLMLEMKIFFCECATAKGNTLLRWSTSALANFGQ